MWLAKTPKHHRQRHEFGKIRHAKNFESRFFHEPPHGCLGKEVVVSRLEVKPPLTKQFHRQRVDIGNFHEEHAARFEERRRALEGFGRGWHVLQNIEEDDRVKGARLEFGVLEVTGN